MITIEHLEVLFDAERQRDEARFAELFARHMEGHDDELRRSAEGEARARRERSVPDARNGW
jgi:DNA-binding GntR family transcriptional regulator